MKVSIDKRIDLDYQPYQLYLEAVDMAGDLVILASRMSFEECKTPLEVSAYLMAFAQKLASGWMEHEQGAVRRRDLQITAGAAGTA